MSRGNPKKEKNSASGNRESLDEPLEVERSGKALSCERPRSAPKSISQTDQHVWHFAYLRSLWRKPHESMRHTFQDQEAPAAVKTDTKSFEVSARGVLGVNLVGTCRLHRTIGRGSMENDGPF